MKTEYLVTECSMSDETELGCFPTIWFQAPSWALPFLSHCCPGGTLPGPWGLEEGPDSLLPPPRCRSSSFPVNHRLRQVSVFPEVASLSCVLMVPHSLLFDLPKTSLWTLLLSLQSVRLPRLHFLLDWGFLSLGGWRLHGFPWGHC